MKTINVESALHLLDFSGGESSLKTLAKGQLEAAVALYNMLNRHSFAYLADEVGMGKTYVTLGVVAMLRHFRPSLRVLFIAPSENLQEKWQKDYINFVRNNYILNDQRVKNFSDDPAVPAVSCRNLRDFARSLASGHYADFFLRMSSFSFGIGSQEDMKQKEQQLRELVPGKVSKPFKFSGNLDLDKPAFKTWYATVLNRLLPHFDLVVIDEAHNLKHGPERSDRNRVLSIVLGSNPGEIAGMETERKAGMALLLSATPYDQDYRQLCRQMMVVGKEDLFPYEDRMTDSETRGIIKNFMVRRLSQLDIDGKICTRNMYRREWRNGGVVPQKELDVQSDLQRLVVALFQKKVSEIISEARFGNSFQMGMLASFESFFATTNARRDNESDQESSGVAEDAAFDAKQTDNISEKDGVDSSVVDRIVRSYKERFDSYLPHPKMDAVVECFKSSFETGEKHLIFARRVMTVPELKDKFSECYDEWIMKRLRNDLSEYLPDLEEIFDIYVNRHRKYRVQQEDSIEKLVPDPNDGELEKGEVGDALAEEGSTASFFSWFFVHDSSDRYFPNRMKKALISSSQNLSTLFEENWLTLLLGRDGTLSKLAEKLAISLADAEDKLGSLATAAYRVRWKIPGDRKFQHRRSFLAVQKAGLLLLAGEEIEDRALQSRARDILSAVFEETWILPQVDNEVPIPNFERFINLSTFFSELRERRELYRDIFAGDSDNPYFTQMGFNRSALILRELIGSSLRLGQGVIALYCDLIHVRKGFALGTEDAVQPLIQKFIVRLESERMVHHDRCMSTYRELCEIRENLPLLIKVNFPEAHRKKPVELSTYFAVILKEQVPVAGMWGGVNKRTVQQFRMPGYPLILISTDVLQEGEDLHTFCSSIIHYGISWTPTAIEQKTGRIDRVGSLASRRFARNQGEPRDKEFIQAYFPYLKDTVEVYQVRKLCHRMNRFLERLHTFAGPEPDNDTRVEVGAEILDTSEVPEQIMEYLSSPFEVAPTDLVGEGDYQTYEFEEKKRSLLRHFKDLSNRSASDLKWQLVREVQSGHITAQWEDDRGVLTFDLFLKSARATGSVLISCSSKLEHHPDKIPPSVQQCFHLQSRARLIAVQDTNDASYELFVQGEFFFGVEETQLEEVNELVLRVVNGHRCALALCDGTFVENENVFTHGKKAKDDILKAFIDQEIPWQVTPRYIRFSRGCLKVKFNLGTRKQEITVSQVGDHFLFTSQGSLSGLHAQLREDSRRIALTWERNYKSDVVDFYFDGTGALSGRICHPVSTLQAEEFAYYAITLAHEMDQVEQLLYQEDNF